jgi:hypothetical protein
MMLRIQDRLSCNAIITARTSTGLVDVIECGARREPASFPIELLR